MKLKWENLFPLQLFVYQLYLMVIPLINRGCWFDEINDIVLHDAAHRKQI